jgi:hypothetical protein
MRSPFRGIAVSCGGGTFSANDPRSCCRVSLCGSGGERMEGVLESRRNLCLRLSLAMPRSRKIDVCICSHLFRSSERRGAAEPIQLTASLTLGEAS